MLPCPRFSRWLILFFLFCFFPFFFKFTLTHSFKTKIVLNALHSSVLFFSNNKNTTTTTTFRCCFCTRPFYCVLLPPPFCLSHFQISCTTLGCEVRVQSIERWRKKMGNGRGVAFIRSTAGRYTATACATTASSSTWPMQCRRLCLSNSTLPPLISMLTVSLCQSSYFFFFLFFTSTYHSNLYTSFYPGSLFLPNQPRTRILFSSGFFCMHFGLSFVALFGAWFFFGNNTNFLLATFSYPFDTFITNGYWVLAPVSLNVWTMEILRPIVKRKPLGV